MWSLRIWAKFQSGHPCFTRMGEPDYLTDDEYAALQSLLMMKPNVGNLIRRSGEVRKVRWV